VIIRLNFDKLGAISAPGFFYWHITGYLVDVRNGEEGRIICGNNNIRVLIKLLAKYGNSLYI